MLLLPVLMGPANACGGFFCSGGATTTTTTGYSLVPVEQNSERILFRVNGDDTVTTFVEVGYQQREDVDFAWIIPIPEPIEASDVSTASADLFNALERATAPRFTFRWTQVNYGYGGYGYGNFDGPRGCGCGVSDAKDSSDFADTGTGSVSSTSTEAAVEVVAESVVGPFAIEVITATDAEQFAQWLDTNGYDLPEGAIAPLQHYVDLQMAFLGVKLAPDVPAGPIDTLQFTYPSVMPMIPIILTSIASAEDLPIQAYVLADGPYIPIGWGMTRDLALETRPDPVQGSDYLQRVATEIDRYEGKAFVLEYAKPTEALLGQYDPLLDEVLAGGSYLTRWRGDISPWQMTVDPEFVPEIIPDYDNVHIIELNGAPGSTTARRQRAWLLLAPLLWLGVWLRRGYALASCRVTLESDS